MAKKGFRASNRIGRADASRMRTAYNNKLEEYKGKTLEELKAIFNNPDKRIGGAYRAALIDIVREKLSEEAIKAQIEAAKADQDKNPEQQDTHPEQ